MFQNEQTDSRAELLSQLIAVFSAQQIQIDDNVLRLMQPLLSGEQDYAGHLASLEHQLESLTA